jgi:hypothetical protein
MPGLHNIVERPERNSTNRQIFFFSGEATKLGARSGLRFRADILREHDQEIGPRSASSSTTLQPLSLFSPTLGMTVEGEAPIEGPWVDRVNGIENVQVDIVMMRTPDGHGKLELTKFRNPKLVEIEPAIAPPNALGLRSVMFAVESVDDTVARLRATAPNSSARWSSTRTSTDSATCEALRASSSRWPRNSSEITTNP